MADPTYEELSAELDTLRSQYSDLQGALKQARARVKELEAGKAEVEALRAEVLDLKLHKPVATLLDGVLVSHKYSSQELADHYKFELNEAGEIEMRDLEGNPVTITEQVGGKDTTRQVRFDEQDVRRFLVNTGNFNHIIRASRATGGGAGPSASIASTYRQEKPQHPAPAKTSFGLK